MVCLRRTGGERRRPATEALLINTIMTAKFCTIRGQGHLHERLNLTQEQFVLRFGFSVAMPRYWER